MPESVPSVLYEINEDELCYIKIQGGQFSVSLTALDLTGMDLTDEGIVPLKHMTELTALKARR